MRSTGAGQDAGNPDPPVVGFADLLAAPRAGAPGEALSLPGCAGGAFGHAARQPELDGGTRATPGFLPGYANPWPGGMGRHPSGSPPDHEPLDPAP